MLELRCQHTPLWRRGLNDELNCNTCGLYALLPHHTLVCGITTARVEPRQHLGKNPQCHNCHTTATPLWRKDDEGKTVCNACGLYFKLHGSARPISMKSDVIRKRSRHDARRGSGSGIGSGTLSETTPLASPGAVHLPMSMRMVAFHPHWLPTLTPVRLTTSMLILLPAMTVVEADLGNRRSWWDRFMQLPIAQPVQIPLAISS
ncbi:hypothetical protein BGW80DRAFT_1180831 [Lactifluus volemus]|nr:hypothetical protein BGW80DRAFT_1180831 [Lactifluus volemus]